MAYGWLALVSVTAVSIGSVAAFSQNTRPDWKLEDDKQHVTVTFPTAPPAVLQLDVAGIEDLLIHLGAFRAVMWPEVPKSYKLGENVMALSDPILAAEREAGAGNMLLHIRDPRYGWLHYMIPREEDRKLGAYIQQVAPHLLHPHRIRRSSGPRTSRRALVERPHSRRSYW